MVGMLSTRNNQSCLWFLRLCVVVMCRARVLSVNCVQSEWLKDDHSRQVYPNGRQYEPTKRVESCWLSLESSSVLRLWEGSTHFHKRVGVCVLFTNDLSTFEYREPFCFGTFETFILSLLLVRSLACPPLCPFRLSRYFWLTHLFLDGQDKPDLLRCHSSDTVRGVSWDSSLDYKRLTDAITDLAVGSRSQFQCRI